DSLGEVAAAGTRRVARSWADDPGEVQARLCARISEREEPLDRTSEVACTHWSAVRVADASAQPEGVRRSSVGGLRQIEGQVGDELCPRGAWDVVVGDEAVGCEVVRLERQQVKVKLRVDGDRMRVQEPERAAVVPRKWRTRDPYLRARRRKRHRLAADPDRAGDGVTVRV